MKRFLLITICFALASVLHSEYVHPQINMRAVAERAKVRHSNVPRKVLAFYYPWYGNSKVESGSGKLSHWSGIDENKRQIASSTNYPSLGPYDSYDPDLIAQHCKWAKRAGIDGFIVSWWGRDSFEDRVMRRLLDGCEQAGMQMAVYYERVPDPKSPTSAAKDIVHLLREHGKHPAWLTVDRRPVIFIYGRAVQEIGPAGWLAAVSEVNDSYPGGAIFIGDQMDRTAARIFDGIHTYNTAASLQNKGLPQIRRWAKTSYSAWLKSADTFGRISTITVIPGYDDTKIRKPGLRVERMDGASYRTQWNAAIDADPHWVLITSFNEWHEGSEIEPSVEFGEKYLTLTAEFASRFKNKGKRQTASVEVRELGITDREKAALRKLLSRIGTGILPDFELEAVWPLLEMGVTPEQLSWEQVVALERSAVKQMPVLVYAAGETYRRSVHRTGDVDDGIIRYLRAGGCLVVLASGPIPFYYDAKQRAVNNCRKFGLPLSAGWEQPPSGQDFRFLQSETRLPHVPKEFPFPKSGDLRWRPFVRSQLTKGDLVVPLLELRDAKGIHHGDAVAFVEHKFSQPKGGMIAYVWFGLLDSPQADGLLHDLFMFVGKHVGHK